jgi:hypothetical protein
MVDNLAALRFRLAVDHRLDAVAVRIEEEGAVVLGAVLGPRSRLAVALVAGIQQTAPPRIDLHVRLRHEAAMQAARHRLPVRGDREVVPLGEGLVLGRLAREVEELEAAPVEPPRALEVGDADRDVIEKRRAHRTCAKPRPWNRSRAVPGRSPSADVGRRQNRMVRFWRRSSPVR